MSEVGESTAACFSGFAWPVPVAFASALAASRFEAGDVLYSDGRAYERWSRETLSALHAVQVLHPPRSARGTPLEGDGDRRQANWDSEVVVSLVELKSGRSEERALTQGKLVMALWTGEEAWLEVERPAPPLPRNARDLHARLDQASSALAKRAKRIRMGSGCQFSMVVDLASDASRAKAAGVEDRLRGGGEVRTLDWSPAEAGFEDPETYHPTLVLRVFSLPKRDLESCERRLREALYRGGSNNGKDGRTADPEEDAAPADRFSVGRHGLLSEVGTEARG